MSDVGPVSGLPEHAVLLATDWLYIDDGSGGDKSVRLLGIAAAMGLAAALATGQALAQGLTTTSPGFYAQITGDAVPRVRVGVNANDAGSIAFGSGAATRDLFLERAGAATLRIGNADAAAPVAQTVGVQNVVAGTSNTAGVAFTINGSQGTGTGAGGSIIFKVAPAGSTGTAVNALATALTIDSGLLVTAQKILATGTLTSNLLIQGPILSVNTNAGQLLFGSGYDIALNRLAAASLQQGQVPSNAPGAQVFTLGEASRGGIDTNVGGSSGTLRSGAGTGSGTGSSLILQTPTTGTTGTTAQTYATRLTLTDLRATFTNPVKFKGYTVATLPTGSQGDNAFVTDALAPTFLAAVVGGGTVVTPVFFDGTNWVGS